MKKSKYLYILIAVFIMTASMANHAKAVTGACYAVKNLELTSQNAGTRELTWKWEPGSNRENTKYKVEVLAGISDNFTVVKTDYTTDKEYTWAYTDCVNYKTAHALRVTPYTYPAGVYTYDCNPAPSQTSLWSSFGACSPTAPHIDAVGATGNQGQLYINWHETQTNYDTSFDGDLSWFFVRRWKSNGDFDKEYKLDHLGHFSEGILSNPSAGHFKYINGGLQNNYGYKYNVSSCYDVKFKDCSSWQTPENTVYTPIENVTSVSCSNQTANGMTVNVTNSLTNLSEGNSGVKLTSFSPALDPDYMYSPTYQQSTSFDVGGLYPNTSYSFKFQTKNQDGLENDEIENWVTDGSCKTLETLDEIAPKVNSLSAVSPVCSGSETTISWSVSDTGGSGLNRVEVYQQVPPDSHWAKVNAGNCAGDKSASGSCTITPSSDSHIYGIHAVDNAGNCITETGEHCGGVSEDSLDTRASKGPVSVSIISGTPTAPSGLGFSRYFSRFAIIIIS